MDRTSWTEPLHRFDGPRGPSSLSTRRRIRILAVAPFRPELSMLVHQAHLGAFALCAQFLGSIDCEEHRLSLTAIGAIFFISELDQPFILMPDDDVSSVRHDLLLV